MHHVLESVVEIENGTMRAQRRRNHEISGGKALHQFARSSTPSSEGEIHAGDGTCAGCRGEDDALPNGLWRIVGGNDERPSAVGENHMPPPSQIFTILSRPLLHNASTPYPARPLAPGRRDGLPFHHRDGPRAVPRRSRRECQDRHKSAGRHAKQPTTTLERKFCSCVQSSSLTPVTLVAQSFTTSPRVPPFAPPPRPIIFDLSDITHRPHRRCKLS